MPDTSNALDNKRIIEISVEVAVRLAVVGLLVVWCFKIFTPFIIPMMWGIIIAVALAPYRYPLDPAGLAVPELTAWRDDDYLVIERDGAQGPEAKFKKVFAVNLFALDSDGYLVKTEVLDLLDIPDPHDIGESGSGSFSFPFETTEALVVVDDSTIGLIDDNNYPFGRGRHTDTGEPDDSEFILVRIREVPKSLRE